MSEPHASHKSLATTSAKNARNKYHRLKGLPRELINRFSLFKSEAFDRLLFVHINKCAGTSIQHALNIPFNHESALDKLNRLGERRFHEAYRFTVVRNPWDRLVSQYAHRVKMNTTCLGDQHISFADWAYETLERKNPKYRDVETMFQTQCQWISDSSGRLLINRIIAFEKLSEGFQIVCDEAGVAANLPHMKISKRSSYLDYYSDSSIVELVGDHFADDVRIFGYAFGEARDGSAVLEVPASNFAVPNRR